MTKQEMLNDESLHDRPMDILGAMFKAMGCEAVIVGCDCSKCKIRDNIDENL